MDNEKDKEHSADASEEINFENLDCKEIVDLLMEQPELAAKCDWKRMRRQLDGYGWARLLSAQPQFAEQCQWASLEGADWAELLAKQPQFADRCR